jgi:hypothetical protein
MKTLKKRVDAANELNLYEERLIRAKTQLITIKGQVESLKTTIDADSDFPQSDKDFMQQAFNLVNHASYTGFIDLIQNQLG